jgi:hypothetical protein
MNSSLLAAALLAVSTIAVGNARAQGSPEPSSWSALRDFMVQDVCVDSSGKVLVGISPIDQFDRCKRRRDLSPSERLSYHKHDWPSAGHTKRQPTGYQRSDSFPFISKSLGFIVIQTLDFGGGNRAFGHFDAGDGGQIVAFSKESASIIMTEDGGRGLQLIASDKCGRSAVSPASLLDSWIISDRRGESLEAGKTVAKLRIVTEPACPAAFDQAYTAWRFGQYRYRTSAESRLSSPLLTLLSSHFGGREPTAADHLERFYFTRELGLTRWERWQNTRFSRDVAIDLRRSREFQASERCPVLEAAPGGEWVLLDCREWSNITAPDDGGGDEPSFWVDRLRATPLSAGVFAN